MVRVALSLAVLRFASLASPAFAGCSNILPSTVEAAGPRRGISAPDLVELRDIGSHEYSLFPGTSPYAVSPDGQSIAFVVTKADLSHNVYCRALVTMSTHGGAPRVIDQGGEFIMVTDVVRGLFSPVGGAAMVVPGWSPDGRWVAYLKRVGGVTQVWRVRSDGGVAEALTKSPTDVDRWAWSSDSTIIFTTRLGMIAANRAIDREGLTGYHYDDRVMTMNGLRPQLREADVPQKPYAIDIATGNARPATGNEERMLPPDALTTDPASVVITSSNGTRAGTENDTRSPLSQRHIWTSAAGQGEQRCAFAACDSGIVRLWWADDNSLIFQRREGWARGNMAIYRWYPGKRAPRRVVASKDWLTGCLYRTAQLFCTAESSSRPARLVSIDLGSGNIRPVFDPNPVFGRLNLGKVERILTRNDIGLDAWADFVLPPDYKPGRKLPLVVVQYTSRGFLRGGTGDDYPIFLLASAGFAVLSVERPPTFGSNRPDIDTADKLITEMTRNWAERRSVLSSLLAGIDRTVERGIVDPTRVGITGLSDGMSTVEYALINTRRFAAAAISTCCEDPKTVMTYGGPVWADWNHAVRKYPLASEDGLQFWKPMSLSLNARSLDTPILMQLADREFLGSLEAYTALREQKKPVDLYVYPDEYHMKWQPLHRRAVYERGIDWFNFWLTGREDVIPSKRAQYERWREMRTTHS